MDKKIHVHFMGIGGSGMAPVAIISKYAGYKVSGCDISIDGYYSSELSKNNIEILLGHNAEHLDGVDILAVSPAVFDLNPDHPEILEGKRRNILMTWQEFSGKYLHEEKNVITVSGTHGKSTTTVLMGTALEYGGFDPTVEAGTVYKPWGGGYRIGNSDYFICEADEFNNNFLNFSPSVIIINNIEMDHPEFFKDFAQVKEAFSNFIKRLKSPGILVVNEESKGIQEILQELKEYIIINKIKTIGYYFDERYDFPFNTEYKYEILNMNTNNTKFKVTCSGLDNDFEIGLSGKHNVANSLGVIAVSLEMGMNMELLKTAFRNFQGIGRRCEFVDEVRGVSFFDDYAHHPTAISAMLDSFKVNYPGKTVWAIWEPHQLSRIKLFLNEFASALNKSDRVIITKTFIGREKYKNIDKIDMNLIINRIGPQKVKLIEDFNSVADFVDSYARPGDIVIVFGAGESYRLTRNIIKKMG